MNSSAKIAKIKKYSRIAAKVMIFLEILFVLAMGLLAFMLYAVSAGLIPDVSDALMELNVAVDGRNITEFSGTAVVVATLAIAVKGVLYLIVMETVRRMLGDISRRETPFEPIHVSRMKRIAILIFIGSFVNAMSIQCNEWLIAAVVWLLAMVFDYGCVLQQESDETL